MAEEKILVVDDDVGMLMLLRHYLTREGYDVTTAPSAETALHPCNKPMVTKARQPPCWASIPARSHA